MAIPLETPSHLCRELESDGPVGVGPPLSQQPLEPQIVQLQDHAVCVVTWMKRGRRKQL